MLAYLKQERRGYKMDILPWITVFSAVVILLLLLKLHLMRKSLREISSGLSEKLACDTNTLIDVSSDDKYIKALATELNDRLRTLSDARNRFVLGDAEVKNAITNISHDLRTPLCAIFGYLDLLECENLTEEQERYIKTIRNRAEMLSSLTEELFIYSLTAAESEQIETFPTNINAVLEESIAAFYALLSEKKITPVINLTEKIIIRNAERKSLSRVFSNLLNNAVRYSDGDLEITLSDNGVVTFANTVHEIGETEVGKLFDRFYTVNSARSSTGLGLAIAKTLVDKMGGMISAKLEKGRLIITLAFSE